MQEIEPHETAYIDLMRKGHKKEYRQIAEQFCLENDEQDFNIFVPISSDYTDCWEHYLQYEKFKKPFFSGKSIFGLCVSIITALLLLSMSIYTVYLVHSLPSKIAKAAAYPLMGVTGLILFNMVRSTFDFAKTTKLNRYKRVSGIMSYFENINGLIVTDNFLARIYFNHTQDKMIAEMIEPGDVEHFKFIKISDEDDGKAYLEIRYHDIHDRKFVLECDETDAKSIANKIAAIDLSYFKIKPKKQSKPRGFDYQIYKNDEK